MTQDKINACTEKNLQGYHYQIKHFHTIGICEVTVRKKIVHSVILHKIGHAFGLCDQYGAINPNHIVFNENCKSDFKSKNPTGISIMASLDTDTFELRDDDLDASKINACRGVVPANRVWIKETKILDTWKKDDYFIKELKRLKALDLDILPECLEILNAPNTTTQTDKMETEKGETEEDETEESDKSSIEKGNYGM